MSQHYFNTQQAGNPVKVLLGWDRPLGHYFMVIEKIAAAVATESASAAPQCEDEDDDEDDDYDDGYLYSNLNERDPFGLSLDHFRGVLSELGILVPEQMFEQIEQDKAMRVGNRHVWYQPDGHFKES
jgi:hypothetical protein